MVRKLAATAIAKAWTTNKLVLRARRGSSKLCTVRTGPGAAAELVPADDIGRGLDRGRRAITSKATIATASSVQLVAAHRTVPPPDHATIPPSLGEEGADAQVLVDTHDRFRQ